MKSPLINSIELMGLNHQESLATIQSLTDDNKRLRECVRQCKDALSLVYSEEPLKRTLTLILVSKSIQGCDQVLK